MYKWGEASVDNRHPCGEGERGGAAIARLPLKVAICDTGGHKFPVTRRHAVIFKPLRASTVGEIKKWPHLPACSLASLAAWLRNTGARAVPGLGSRCCVSFQCPAAVHCPSPPFFPPLPAAAAAAAFESPAPIRCVCPLSPRSPALLSSYSRRAPLLSPICGVKS